MNTPPIKLRRYLQRKRPYQASFRLCFSLSNSTARLALLLAIATGTAQAGELVLVMDDLGNNLQRDRQVLELPGPITLALLPFAPHSIRMAKMAQAAGKEVILHQPMQSQRGHARKESGSLHMDMSDAEFEATLTRSLAAIPSIIGINNHTGSLLTEHHAPMARIMQALQASGLFFLDSRTTPNTVATDVARQLGVPARSRDVFLDHHRDPAAIHKQFEQAMRLAQRRGRAILIAHPYPESFAYLAAALHNLPTDVRITPLSAVMPGQPALQPALPVPVPIPIPLPLPIQVDAPITPATPEHQIALAPPESPASRHRSLGR